MYYITFQYQGEIGMLAETLFIESATSFDDACNQIKEQIPSATNFINKTI